MSPAEREPGDALRAIAPDDTNPNVRWARRNIPGADRPGISASELADLCIAFARELLDSQEDSK